ncbi:MAG: DUF1549 and DUF1553 domain-containing protein [Verrucomicrobia bacterium]|nr:DUF1549 and DUF1553 domain-containing protein [Verrucomicrobiota bacterium]
MRAAASVFERAQARTRFRIAIAVTRIAIAVTLILTGGLVSSSGQEEPTRAGLDWWAFQPIEKPHVPSVPSADGATSVSAIDSWIRQRLRSAGLRPATAADREVLIRRVYYDLIGLPPTLEEIDLFTKSASPTTAYVELVDRLLASERFGERWARHWFDVVRFAETNGYERDEVKPNLWKYRDWVIQAFNTDMPYDQFVLEQLAGDEIEERSEQSVVATGMLRAGTWNDEPNNPNDYKYERLEDMVEVVSTAFMGVTVHCARCHDHKFDPIPQRDYYRFAAAFWPGAIEPRDRALMGGPSDDELGMSGVFGWTDITINPTEFRLLKNGDAHQPAEVVEPGHLSLVPVLDRPLQPAPAGAATNHRRVQMAKFITDPRNPLTARVMVNRLWQQLLGQGILRTPNNFGFKADVPSHPELLDWLAADFMAGGWRMKRMIRQIILSETYQQSSVHPDELENDAIDSGNRLLWKANRRRADAESLRDSMLHITGELNLSMGGPSFYPIMAPEVLEGFSRKADAWTPSPEPERMRRSVYMMTKRHLLLPFMTTFDFPNSEKPCGKRDLTTVAPQALAMLNNAFVHERSTRLALMAMEQDADIDQQIRFCWSKVLGRLPKDRELVSARSHIEQQLSHFQSNGSAEAELQAVASLCHVLVNTNEFLYVD